MTSQAAPSNSSHTRNPQTQQGLFRENWDEFRLLGNTLISLQKRCHSVSFEHLLQHTGRCLLRASMCLKYKSKTVCMCVNDSVSLEGETRKSKTSRKKLQVKALNGCVHEAAGSIAARCGSPSRNNSPYNNSFHTVWPHSVSKLQHGRQWNLN